MKPLNDWALQIIYPPSVSKTKYDWANFYTRQTSIIYQASTKLAMHKHYRHYYCLLTNSLLTTYAHLSSQ